MTGPAGAAAITLAQVYLVSAEFKHNGNPLALPQNTPHQVNQVGVQTALMELTKNEVWQILVTVANLPTEDSLYQFKVELAAIVARSGDAPQMENNHLLEVGTAFIYPFARETVANLTMRGRFGPIWLNPFNVRAALEANRQQAQSRAVEAVK